MPGSLVRLPHVEPQLPHVPRAARGRSGRATVQVCCHVAALYGALLTVRSATGAEGIARPLLEDGRVWGRRRAQSFHGDSFLQSAGRLTAGSLESGCFSRGGKARPKGPGMSSRVSRDGQHWVSLTPHLGSMAYAPKLAHTHTHAYSLIYPYT